MSADPIAGALAGVGLRTADVPAPVRAWLRGAPVGEVAEALERAADPAAALHALGTLLDAAAPPPMPGRVAPLLRLLGGSAELAAALIGEASGWPSLFATVLGVPVRARAAHARALADAGASGALPRGALQTALRTHRRRELVRIGGRDLAGLASVDETVREITTLAESLIDAAVTSVRARTEAEEGELQLPESGARAGFCVIGMGKLGGRELNYSSDVDLVYVYERDGGRGGGRTLAEVFCRLAAEVSRALQEVTDDGRCLRVDLRLRPGGTEGPIAVSLPAALDYYEGWGRTWERAAWLKARPVAGDVALGAALLDELAPFVHRRYLDFGTIEDLKEMKARVDASLGGTDAAARDVKLGRGGIREAEFFVQAHQLVHGGRDERLRVTGTLEAVAALVAGGYVERAAGDALAAAYRFLRDVEHKLQIVHGRQTQRLPSSEEEVQMLARRVGLHGARAGERLAAAYAEHTTAVRESFTALFHRGDATEADGDPDVLAGLVEAHDDVAGVRTRLAQLGFRDAESAARELRLLRAGPPHAPATPRRLRALARLAPALLREIARSGAPDRALRHMATFVTTVGARSSYLYLLIENPATMRLLVRLFAAGEYLSGLFLRHPELLDSLVRADLVRLVRPLEEMEAELRGRMAAAADHESELDTLRRFQHEELLRIAVHDLEGTLAPEEVGAQLADLATACLGAALAVARRRVLARARIPPDPATEGLAVLGMGKLGGHELHYASDLDLIFVYDPGDSTWSEGRPAPQELFARIAQATITALQTPTREGIAYRIDTRLRPSGNQGALVSSLDAFAEYHATSARVWERQALVRATPVAGPPALCSRLGEIVARFVYGRGLTAAEVVEIADVRSRIAAERGGRGGISVKTDRGGLVDVEFLVQMLQLRHGHDHPEIRTPTTHRAIGALVDAGILDPEDGEVLATGYAFLRAVESRLGLEGDAALADADDEAVHALARRLRYEGTDDDVVGALRADHARHRTAVRDVYDRRFVETS